MLGSLHRAGSVGYAGRQGMWVGGGKPGQQGQDVQRQSSWEQALAAGPSSLLPAVRPREGPSGLRFLPAQCGLRQSWVDYSSSLGQGSSRVGDPQV